MADILKIITTGVAIVNRVQDNIQAAKAPRSDITEGFLVEDVDYSGTVNHGLGRQPVGAFVVNQTGGADPVIITDLNSTSLTTTSSGSGTASIWVF
jgi:hypothetical protein